MVYSSSKNFLYIHIYKTAGTSLRNVLDRYASPPWSYTTNQARCLQRLDRLGVRLPGRYFKVIGKHLKLTDSMVLLPEEARRDVWSFTFVRNAWDWLVSIYHYILKDGHHPDHALVVSLRNFESFIDWYLSSEQVELQSDFILKKDGRVGVDFIGRFEHLQEDYAIVANRLGLPELELPHRNVSSRARDYRVYYSDELAARVGRVFKSDIDRFNFRFDPE
jgi:hypothetical protein